MSALTGRYCCLVLRRKRQRPKRVDRDAGPWRRARIFYTTAPPAFGTREPTLITSNIIVLPLAMILIVLALVLSLVALSSRGLLSPSPLLTSLYYFAQIHNRPYFNRSESMLKAWLL